MTRKTRVPSSVERALFETVFKDVKPLKGRKLPAAKPPPRKAAPAAEPVVVPKPPRASTHSAGLDGRTAERLRRGQLQPEARLDLHGLTEAAAHGALVMFLRSAQARGLRLVLVVTGKGGKASAPDEPFDMELDRRSRGVLRTMTPRWLAEASLARFVAATHEAHRRHGGAGALYVYLRKSRT